MAVQRRPTHDVLARQTSEDLGRAAFIVDLKRELRGRAKDNEIVLKRTDAASEDLDEIEHALGRQDHYRFWSALTRTAQDMMWTTVATTIERDEPRMKEAARRWSEQRDKMGSLELDPDLPAPKDVVMVDIHCQPGGYMIDRGGGDLLAGALYESGGNIYTMGAGIGDRDSKAEAVVGMIERHFPECRPRRILDLGCTVGNTSLAYAEHYPGAEIHAVDVGAGLLRYAHARAEAMGVAIHFHQMNAAELRFEEGAFDLVVSHNLLHEVSRETMARIFLEARRVARPGGVVAHQDVGTRGRRTAFERFLYRWESRNNNEPFWLSYAEADISGSMRAAGFVQEAIHEAMVPKSDGPGTWYVICAAK